MHQLIVKHFSIRLSLIRNTERLKLTLHPHLLLFKNPFCNIPPVYPTLLLRYNLIEERIRQLVSAPVVILLYK